MISITQVKIKLVKPQNGLIGFASLVVNDQIKLTSIAIRKLAHKDGFRLLYPTKQDITIFNPLDGETSKMIEQVVFNELNKQIKENSDYGYNSICSDR